MIGKRVARRIYAHVSLVDELPEADRVRIESAIRISELQKGENFHVVRLDRDHDEVTLLSYPEFFEEPFPSLLASWRIHLPTRSVRFRDYSNSLNPPILHRKELMLPSSHPDQERLQTLTRLAESLGLFDDPVRIGFRSQWNELVASKGYVVVDQQLQPASNEVKQTFQESSQPLPAGTTVYRHLTALSRSFLSAPVQALLRHDLIKHPRTFFDYGCGKGDDLEGVHSLGIVADGWDPYFRPDGARVPADVVNIGFVINVIEDFSERIAALKGAYELTKGVLSVSAMLWSPAATKGRPFGDGYLTTRNTFQKYYSQGELQSFLESVLDEQTTPVGPGIFFAFKDRHLEQQFLSSRQSDPTRAPRLLAARSFLPRAVRPPRPTRSRVEEDPERKAVTAAIWQRALQLGRLPEEDEFADQPQTAKAFGSWPRALRATSRIVDQDLLRRAADARTDEIRAIFALQAFGRRKPFRDLELHLQRDVKAFFGSLGVAEAEGRRLLHQCADVTSVKAACERAASSGLGWLESDHSLQLHTSLVSRLEPVLRVYVSCAVALYGDVLSADLVKIHIQSGKITLMKFDDFMGKPLPRLLERVKVKLRDQDLEMYEYGEKFPPPYLYFKSRYINEEFPCYPEQKEFDQQLKLLGLPMKDGYGPTTVEFDQWLVRQRHEVSGIRLRPSTQVASLDDPCGQHFTFRQLIECGSTWERTQIDNVPRSPNTYNALLDLTVNVLDPVIEYFGAIKLTYGFASPALSTQIKRDIAPRIDQHAACEVGSRGAAVCARKGAAVDFLVEYEDMREVAKWISDNCRFDRLYFYGPNRPIHVSYGPEMSGGAFELISVDGRRIPRRLSFHSNSAG